MNKIEYGRWYRGRRKKSPLNIPQLHSGEQSEGVSCQGEKSGVGKKRRIFLSADNDSFPFFPGAFCMGEFVCIFLLTLCILRQSSIDKT
jgi:hypothetical protein